jgi:hypothetical protein
MEDNSWEGWTTPLPPPGVELGYPEGRMLTGAAPSGWIGEVRAMTKATDDTIKYAERNWPRVQPDDFERTGRRRYVERATGVEYDLCHGNDASSAGRAQASAMRGRREPR